MTNTYCVYTVLRYSWWWTVDMSETCRVLYRINLEIVHLVGFHYKNERKVNFILVGSFSILTTGPKTPPERFLHLVRSRASTFKWDYPLMSLRSSSSFLRLLPRLLVTSNSPFIFPSITCFRRQFLRKMWPIQLAFRFLISCRIFLCSLTLITLLHFSHDRSNWFLHPSPAPHFETFEVFLIAARSI